MAVSRFSMRLQVLTRDTGIIAKFSVTSFPSDKMRTSERLLLDASGRIVRRLAYIIVHATNSLSEEM